MTKIKNYLMLLLVIITSFLLVACSEETYLVVFSSGSNATTIDHQIIDEGEFAVEPEEDPVREGFIFEYWEHDGFEFVFRQEPIVDDTVLNAVWSVDPSTITYTVTFNTNGGTAIKDQIVLSESLLEVPSIPLLEGYTFLHWEYNGLEWDFNNDKVLDNITLNAIYSKNGPTDLDLVTKVMDELIVVSETNKNFTVPTSVDLVTINWTISKGSAISKGDITNNLLTLLVTSDKLNQEVTLEAEFKLSDVTLNKSYLVLVLGFEDSSEPDPDNPSNNDPNIIKYYNALSGLGREQLKVKLRDIIKTTGRATGSTSQVKAADLYNGKNYNIYDGFGSYGNREHVWPNSKLGGAPKYDLHNLRAAVVSTNSKRSNFPFGEGSGSWKLTNQKFYPGDEHIGDVARIVLYIHVRYNLNINLVGNLEMFLKWHKMDPVSDFERSRNNNIQDIQSNRNPFIDYPEYVDLLFS